MIIDVHNHIGKSGDGAQASGEELLSVMDLSGIDQAVVFPIDDRLEGSTYPKLNDAVLAFQEKHPKRIIGFCRVDPNEGQAALDEVNRSLENGLQGIKLHPASDHFLPNKGEPIFALARERKVPILLHSGYQKRCHPRVWAPLLEQFPEVRVTIAHGAKDAYRDLVHVFTNLPHVYIETSCLSMYRSNYILKALGAERIVFGTDYPYSHPELERRKLELLIADDKQRDLVFRKNPLAFLGKKDV